MRKVIDLSRERKKSQQKDHRRKGPKKFAGGGEDEEFERIKIENIGLRKASDKDGED